MNILYFSPHTDDAEFGAGGAASRFLREGHSLLWVAFSTAKESQPNPKVDILKTEFLEAMKVLGVGEHVLFDFPVRRLCESRQEILEIMFQMNKDLSPDLVIGPSSSDYHQDHQTVANEMVRAFKKSCTILGYELPWNHIEFRSKAFIKLTAEDLEKKTKVLECYKSQKCRGNYLSKEVIEGLALVRGTQCSSLYAEAYETLRWVI